jgi:hypothetical protein
MIAMVISVFMASVISIVSITIVVIGLHDTTGKTDG